MESIKLKDKLKDILYEKIMDISIDTYKKSPPPKMFAWIDIHCEIQAVPFAQLSQMQPGEPSAAIRERVIAARKFQEERFKPYKGIHCNAMADGGSCGSLSQGQKDLAASHNG